MARKRIYFVRHGESESNVTKVVQGLHDVLTAEGERQVLRIAERAQGLDFSALISSDAVRTKATAEAIAEATGKEITFSPLFRELKRPTSIIGYSWETEEYKKFKADSAAHVDDPLWHQEDEENFFDGVARAKQALSLLEEHLAEDILVVTHGLFMKYMGSHMIFGDALTPALFDAWNAGVRASNTGLTICERKEEGGWLILTWNDHAHLAD